jgi:2-polyprenyl-3-methyl-5-hydroxy-6-metoxy-1,4-benzoquinol methylase
VHAATPTTPKDPSYYGNARTDVLRFLTPPLGRVLDVGCGAGANAADLRRMGVTEIVGIEIHEPSGVRAREVFDEVLIGAVEEQLPNVHGEFDTILCYDVLEHLVDPYAVVQQLRQIATPGGHLHVSLPNARNWTLMRDVALKGSFGYTKEGHRDATHLRWFTKRDAADMLTRAGWKVERIDHQELTKPSALLERITRGTSAEFLVFQWALLGRAS